MQGEEYFLKWFSLTCTMFSVSMLFQKRKFNLLPLRTRAFQTLERKKVVYVYMKLKINSNLDLVQLYDYLSFFCNSVFF